MTSTSIHEVRLRCLDRFCFCLDLDLDLDFAKLSLQSKRVRMLSSYSRVFPSWCTLERSFNSVSPLRSVMLNTGIVVQSIGCPIKSNLDTNCGQTRCTNLAPFGACFVSCGLGGILSSCIGWCSCSFQFPNPLVFHFAAFGQLLQ